MKVSCISDLHGQLPHHNRFVKEDLVCICGDIMPMVSHSIEYQKDWFRRKFAPWFNNLPAKYAVFIGGNHDYYLQGAGPELFAALKSNRFYLKDETVEIEGRTILGIPWCSNLPRWAFNMEEDSLAPYLKQFSHLKGKVDIMMLHAAPKIGNYGKSMDKSTYIHCPKTGAVTKEYPDYGNQVLADFIYEIEPKLAIYGHIHTGEHSVFDNGKTKLANVSYLDEDYTPKYSPLVLDI